MEYLKRAGIGLILLLNLSEARSAELSCDPHLLPTPETVVSLLTESINALTLSTRKKDTQRVPQDVQQVSKYSQLYLLYQGIQFKKKTNVMRLENPGLKLQFDDFEILPGQTSNYNRIANALFKTQGTKIFFSPVTQVFWGNLGSYAMDENAILLSFKALNQWPASSTLIHEIVHSQFEIARRRETPASKLNWPVHVSFYAPQGLFENVSGYTYYSHEMVLEEMRTFAVTMQSDVLRIEKESDPKLKSQLMNSLGMYVNLYFDVLKISEKVATEALKMIAGGHFKLETDTQGYKTLEIFEDKEILSVSIFIPSKITDSEEAKSYATTQFENSIKLARFSMEYLAYMQPELNNPLDLDLLFKHPSAQAQFVRALHQKELR